MNQILISEKIYVTPELKKKKKIFRLEFVLSVFLLCVLSSYAIYAEYDRNKNEAVSKDLLESINYGSTREITTLSDENNEAVKVDNDALIIVLNKPLGDEEVHITNEIIEDIPEQENMVASDGSNYTIIGEITIPSIDVNYPIILPESLDNIDTLLKISVCKFHGANPNTVGNFCIVGHNYRNSKFFSKVQYLNIGDIIEIKDLTGTTLQYKIYQTDTVDPEDVSCTSQITHGRKEVTLITCTNDNKLRYIVKAREVL